MKDFNSKHLLFCCLLSVSLGACQRDRNHPGYRYLDDMVHSPAYRYYSENPNFKDGKTAQPPVPGTIARGAVPYPYANTIDEQKRAGRELVNPIGHSPEDIKIGKEKYAVYCAMCHGAKGKGDGNLVQSGKFGMPAPPLVADYVQNEPDGAIFHTITVGTVSGLMGSHSLQLKPYDRWRVVKYIKTGLKNE
ncbi:MAG: cytochrome c [Deltaproteobacteria bacterium]|nr:cytochrome c [Deltaproteobacteria bacterium]